MRGAGANVTYDPAPLVYQLFEQTDGKWRVVQDAAPKIVAHVRDATSTLDDRQLPSDDRGRSGARLVDERRGERRQGEPRRRGAERQPVLRLRRRSKAASPRPSTPTARCRARSKDDIDDIAFRVASTDKDGKSVSSSGRVDKAVFNVGVDGLKSRKLFDLLTLLSVHRADLAAARVGAEGPAAAARGAGREVRRGRRGVEGDGRLPAWGGRARRRKIRRRRDERGAGQRARRDRSTPKASACRSGSSRRARPTSPHPRSTSRSPSRGSTSPRPRTRRSTACISAGRGRAISDADSRPRFRRRCSAPAR